MKDINNFNCTGRLTRDAELKYTQIGCAICTFAIAYNRSEKKGDIYEDKACYIDCVIYAKRGEILTPMLTKGKQVAISGELDHQRWKDAAGKANSKHVVIVNDIVIGSSGKNKAQDDGFDDDQY
jgi:single-strand DNA-binding protein